MFIEIEDLKKVPLHVQHVFPVGEIRFTHEDAGLTEPVAVDFVLTHEERDLRVDGRVETNIRFRCSRCTKEFSKPFSANFDLTYLPQPKWSNEDAEIELKYDDMQIAYYDGVALDVNLMVLEQIELAMPMNFVCREDCRGLCYKCGADLNEGACLCKNEESDSRMSVLLEFRKKADK
ncbi:MAG TPA: DUF177 domain-containing protein [Acidobacteriota bacterium]|nr:DUF177 domain-containing protein [Acidobacteriota bacterium]